MKNSRNKDFNMNEEIEIIAFMENRTVQEVQEDIDFVIKAAYETNPIMRSLGKNGNMPTLEDIIEYIVREIENKT